MDNTKGKNIFIIEDNKLFSIILQTEIKNSFPEENFSITIFESGEACKDSIHLKPDLAIVDYHLNGGEENQLNGLQVIDMIRDGSSETDFIMITIDEQTELFLRSKNHDVYDYLTKSSNFSFKLKLSLTHWLKTKNYIKD